MKEAARGLGLLVERKGRCAVCAKDATRKDRIDTRREDGTRKTWPEIEAEEAAIYEQPLVHIRCGENADGD
ncbi:MAG: hypothetical protein ACR2OE_04100 [Thermomicrobiales bacterium]